MNITIPVVNTQYKFVKSYAKFYMNIRFYVVFHLRQKFLNITHTKEMRIKADHIIIIKIVIAFKIATTYIKHLLYIRCVLRYFTQTSE